MEIIIIFYTFHVAQSIEAKILAFLDHKPAWRQESAGYMAKTAKSQKSLDMYIHIKRLWAAHMFCILVFPPHTKMVVVWIEGSIKNLLVWKMQTGSNDYNSRKFCDFASLAVWWEDICMKACKLHNPGTSWYNLTVMSIQPREWTQTKCCPDTRLG